MELNLRQFGIDQREQLKEGSLDFELLHLPEEMATKLGVCNLDVDADKLRARLPHRIVITTTENKITSELCAISNEGINLDGKENAILTVYDEWIKFLIKRNELSSCSLSFYFEGLVNAAQQWKQVSIPSYLTEIVSGSGSADTISENMPRHSRSINLWRHISLFGNQGFWNEVINKSAMNTFYYQECTYSDPFFSYLSSLNFDKQSFQQQYMLRQVLEMSLCRVAIIDERIAQTVEDKTDFSDPLKLLAPTLAWMGIWVIGSVVFRKNGEEEIVFNLCQQGTEAVLPKMIIDYRSEAFISSIEYQSGLNYFPQPPTKIEILTVHQTILDGKFKKAINNFLEGEKGYEDRILEHWALGMKRGQVLFVFSHSGRGHPGELLPENTPFLDYSFLQTHILSQPSKFFFVQLALASRRRMVR